jgi:hypothetical protein
MTEPTDQASTAELSRHAIHYQPLFQTLELMDVQQLIDTVEEPWYNQTLVQVGDVLVRLGVMQGEFHWHKPDEQDDSSTCCRANSTSSWKIATPSS